MWYLLNPYTIIFLVLGLVFGSFFNALIFRLPSKEYTISSPKRSFCPTCKHQLSWKDNIPLVSYAMLKGHCRYCGTKISMRYPLIEAMTGSIFFLNSILFPLDQAVSLCLLASGLIISAFIDMDHYLIPDTGVILTGVGAFFWALFGNRFPGNLWQAAVVTGVWLAFYFIANSVKKDSFGFGDVELFAALSLGIGLIGSLFTVMFSSFIALGTYLFIGLSKHKKFDGKARLPFGPFIALGAYIVFILLDSIERLYGI